MVKETLTTLRKYVIQLQRRQLNYKDQMMQLYNAFYITQAIKEEMNIRDFQYSSKTYSTLNKDRLKTLMISMLILLSYR